MCASRSGILNLSCGTGKTCIALHHIATRKVPALVIVNNTTLIDQWTNQINKFLEVEGGVGLAQGPPDTWDWEGRGIVLAMIHSLSMRYEELPAGFDRYFGGIYYDETHHLSAPLFVHSAPMFYGARYGLTATVNREDGLESIYQYHIGPVFFRYLMQDLKPRIYIQEIPVHVNFQDPDVKKEISDCRGMPSIPKLRGYVCTRPETNEFIANKLQVPLQKGRKVLALSHCVEQLCALNAMFPDSGLCIGDVAPHERIETLRHKQITFGTLQLVKEALDEETLDTIFFLTPFGSSGVEMGGKNSLQQGMGRILRPLEGKKHPVVVIVDPIYIPKLHRMCGQLKRLINAWPRDEGGPFEYTILSPYEEKEPK
jgi:superfamily II DNA or RNA helicase